ncbi:MAG: CYTH domain-containing protein [Bacteroidales bacterium]|nr:CYTH domain-containing protein [Bacteroidales bacterium]
MPVETERKFLVQGDFKKEVRQSIPIIQGYLSSAPQRTVRIRIWNDRAYITIKGKSNDSGTQRFEWEKEIPVREAQDLLLLCEPGQIQKTRYIIPAEKNLYFEVDEFQGNNQGLILAEIELPEENFPFTKPSWLGKEVTGDIRYYNAYLSQNPYKNWK